MFIISSLLTAIFIHFIVVKYYFSLNIYHISLNLFLYIIKVLLNLNLKLWWTTTSSKKRFLWWYFLLYIISISFLNGQIIFQINNKLISDCMVNGSHSYMQSNGVIKNIMIKNIPLICKELFFFFFTMIESEFLFHTHSLSIYHIFVVHSVFVF